jgi:hypothetical protein
MNDVNFFSTSISNSNDDEEKEEDDDDAEGDIDVGLVTQIETYTKYVNDGGNNKAYFVENLEKVQAKFDALSDRDREVITLCNKLSNVLNQNQDVLEDAYGDGSKITVTPTDIKVIEYDCGY